MKGKEVLGRAVEAVTFLFAMFSGFLEKVAPPEEANTQFTVGLGSFMALVILLFISVLSRGRFSAKRRTLWMAVAGALAVIALVSGLLYQRHLGTLTYFYPPEDPEAEQLVRGTRYTPQAQALADQGLGPGQILARFNPENINQVWPPETIETAKTILTVNYLILVLSLAGTIFSLVEVYLAGEKASEVRAAAKQAAEEKKPAAS